MALKLSLKPGEKIAVNGAVIVNGDDRRASLVVENKARILRERDIMQPAEANSPARRIYFAVMMLYLDSGDDRLLWRDYETRLRQFAGVIETPAALRNCARLSAAVANRDFYKALNIARELIAFEEERLSDVA